MKTRCYNTNQRSYRNYGARGIRVCERWLNDFPAFLSDMGRCPDGYSLDRIDNDGPYAPDNCRWASPTQQMNNQRTNRRVEFQGKTMTVSEWERALGFKPGTVKRRLQNNWAADRALAQPTK